MQIWVKFIVVSFTPVIKHSLAIISTNFQNNLKTNNEKIETEKL
jgi:hypothetical protein